MLKINREFIISFVLILLLKLILEFGYVNFVVYNFEYDGFIYNFDLVSYILGWCLYILVYQLLYLKRNLYIYDIYVIIFVLWVLPNITFYVFTSHNFYYLILLLFPFIFIVLFTFENKFKNIKKLKRGKIIILMFSFCILLIVIIHFIIVSGGKYILNFSDVYDLRREYSEYSSMGIFGYLNSWSFKIFSLLILSWAIYKNKIFEIAISLFMIILLFIFSGHKSALVGFIIVPFFYFLYKLKNTTNAILIFFIFVIVLSMFLGIILNSLFPESIIIRRMFMVPAFLNYTYLDFFSNNELIYWSNSILSSFFSYPYNNSLPYVIGEYLGYAEMGANTGFLASGFAHANILGIFIYTIIAIVIMNLLNSLAKENSKFFVMSIIVMPITSMYISSDLPTAMLTHGLLISILILYLYNDKKYVIKVGKLKYEI